MKNESKKNTSWPLWAKISVAAVILAAVIAGIIFGFNVIGKDSNSADSSKIPEGMTVIPDILSQDIDSAREKLGESNLKLVIGEKVESEEVEENHILEQSPKAGEIVKIGTVIEVKISAGAPKQFVADVEGCTEDFAVKELESLGFKVKVKHEYSSEAASGVVIGQSVKEGEELKKGETITITVSKGNKGNKDNKDNTGKHTDKTETASVTVPNITGMNIEKAKALLKKQNLFLAIYEKVYSDTIPEGTVLGQLPLGGTKAEAGDRIDVSISVGAKKLRVPDVVYKTQEEAQRVLKADGFIVKIKKEENSKVKEGVVFEQSIKAGSLVKANTEITIKVSTGYTVTVPDVVNEKMSDAQSKLADAGLSSTISYQKSDKIAKGLVISQSVSAGSKVKQGSNVHLVISAGKDEVPPQKVVFTGIEIVSYPLKSIYYIGDSFNESGLKVMAVYSDSSKKDVTDECELDGFDSKDAGAKFITVTYKAQKFNRTASFTVYVRTPKVNLSRKNVTVAVNSAVRISAFTEPIGQKVFWSSTDEKVVKAENGKITGLKTGTEEVCASIKYNGKTYKSSSCKVTVLKQAVPVENITLSETSKTLEIGDSFTLTATVLPTTASNQNVSWSSSDRGIAEVKDGVVTAKSSGTAVIYAKAANGKTAQCTVNVKELRYDLTLVKGSNIVSVEGAGSYKAGEAVTVKATAEDKCMFSAWVSDNPSLVKDSARSEYSFVMPESDITLTAQAQAEKYSVKTEKTRGVSTVTGAGAYAPGERVTVKAELEDGYEFREWVSDRANKVPKSKSIEYTFTMPDKEVRISASALKKNPNIVDEGWCGEKIKYTLDSEGTLIITGTGEMYPFIEFEDPEYRYNVPWEDERNLIKTVIINEGVTNIGMRTFYNCKNLEYAVIADSVKIVDFLGFSNCVNLKSYPIMNGVADLGESAFNSCKSLTEVTLAESMNCLAPDAFSHCEKLKEVNLNENLETIAYHCFKDCDSLKEICLPAKLNDLWFGITKDSDNLENIYVSPENKKYCDIDGVVYSKDKKTIIQYPCARQGVYTILSNVETIYEDAFSGCRKLTGVELPESLISIGRKAFNDCENIRTLELPSKVAEFNYGATLGCKNLSEIKVSPNNEVYSDYKGVLYTKDGKKLLYCPEGKAGKYDVRHGTETIAESAFSKCNAVKSIKLPDSVKVIEWNAFSNCDALESINIPRGVETIESSTFAGCDALKNVKLVSGSLKVIEWRAFVGCTALESINIPKGVTEIASSVFEDCKSLKKVKLPEGLEVIEYKLFLNCTSLENINIPLSVKTIESEAFTNCNNLKSITLTGNVEDAGYAFGNWKSDQTIYVDVRKTSIPDWCYSLNSYHYNHCYAKIELIEK